MNFLWGSGADLSADFFHGWAPKLGVWVDLLEKNPMEKNPMDGNLGGGFKHFLFSPLFGEDSHFD